MAPSVTDVTVVIPVYNRVEELEQTLPSYISSGIVKEIIIVDDHSTYDLGSLIERLRLKYPAIRLIRSPRRLGSMAARSLGIAAATTRFVLLGEDDVYLQSGYIGALRDELISRDFDVMSGKLFRLELSRDESIMTMRGVGTISTEVGFPNDHFPFVVEIERFEREMTTEVPYTHMIVLAEREALTATGNDPWYKKGNGYREDTDLLLDLRSRGARIGFTQKTECYHLRGDYGQSGGNRINRIVVEYWAAINTYYMVRKYFRLLSQDFPIGRSPFWATVRYMWHRVGHYARRAVKARPSKM